MVTIDITENTWLAKASEAAFAAGGATGGGTDAYDQEALQAADLSAIDRVVSLEITPNAPTRNEEFAIDDGTEPSVIKNIERGPGTIILKCYLQSSDFFDLAFPATIGTIPTSLAFHFDNGIMEKDIFGCVITEWKCEPASKTETFQTITFTYRDIADGGTITKVAFNTDDFSVFSDVSATIDGKTSALLFIHNLTLTITRTLRDDDTAYCLGDDKLRLPSLKGRNVEIDFTYSDRAANTWEAFSQATATADELLDLTASDYFDATIVLFTTLTVSMTNVYVIKTNSGVRTEHGEIMHEATMKRGVGFTIA